MHADLHPGKLLFLPKENGELGAHLANSIRLGVFCTYEPEKADPLDVFGDVRNNVP